MSEPTNVKAITEPALRNWALFKDWCLSRATEPDAIDGGLLRQFDKDVPVAESTRRRRREHILAFLAGRGIEIPTTTPARSSTIRIGEEFVTPLEALGQLPTLRHPVGLRGRRDGWLILLIGFLGMSRREALDVTESDIVVYPVVTIKGSPVDRTEFAATCPRCAMFRWLRVAGLASLGDRKEVADILDPFGVDLDEHDCDHGLDGTWRRAETLAPAIDKRGYVTFNALSPESVSNIMAYRLTRTGFIEKQSVRLEPTGRFKDATSAELVAAQDDVDARMEALLARSAELLDDADGMMARLDELM